MAEVQEFPGGTSGTVEEVKARIEAMVHSAVDEALARREAAERPEIAEPEDWWNLYAYGPIQPIDYLRPHRVIKVGESFYVATILWLSPDTPAVQSTCTLLTGLGATFEVQYCTGKVSAWTQGPPELNVTHQVATVPGKCWYVDLLQVDDVPSGWEGCYEMNICAHVPGQGNILQFAGYASAVKNVDWNLFYPSWWEWSAGGPADYPRPYGRWPHWEWGIPTKFMIYP